MESRTLDKKFYTYIILTQNDKLYCGYTDSVEKRYKKHLEGTASKFTRANKPKEVVYVAEFETKQEAMKEEYRIKHLSRLQKNELIENNNSANIKP